MLKRTLEIQLRWIFLLFVLSSLLILAIWPQLHHRPLFFILFVSCFILPLSFGLNSFEFLNSLIAIPRLSGSLSKSFKDRIIGIIVVMPAFLYLLLTFREEFSNQGDNTFHFSAVLELSSFWLRASLLVFFFAIGSYFFMIRTQKKWWPLVASLVLLLAGFLTTVPLSAIRYPALGYFLGSPLTLFARVTRWNYPFNILPINVFLALLTWVFVLRPRIVGKRPDMGLLVYGSVFLFHPEIVRCFTSLYLEPWGILLSLLAIEYLFVEKNFQPWVPCLLIGLAGIGKEYCIFLLPFLVLASFDGLFSSWKQFWSAAITFVCAISPFSTYLLLRGSTLRHYELASLDRISWIKFYNFYDLLFFQFGYATLFLLLLTFSIFVYLLAIKKQFRSKLIWVYAAGIFQLFLLYFDKGGVDWAEGYARYHWLAYAIFTSPLLLISQVEKWPRKINTVILCATFGLNVYGLNPVFMNARQPGYLHYDSTRYEPKGYVPIRTLIRLAEKDRLLVGGEKIFIEDPYWSKVGNIGFYYWDLKQYQFVSVTNSDCSCSPTQPAILKAIFYESDPHFMSKAFKLSQDLSRVVMNRCVLSMNETCSNVFLVKSSSGDVIGALGIQQN